MQHTLTAKDSAAHAHLAADLFHRHICSCSHVRLLHTEKAGGGRLCCPKEQCSPGPRAPCSPHLCFDSTQGLLHSSSPAGIFLQSGGAYRWPAQAPCPLSAGSHLLTGQRSTACDRVHMAHAPHLAHYTFTTGSRNDLSLVAAKQQHSCC